MGVGEHCLAGGIRARALLDDASTFAVIDDVLSRQRFDSFLWQVLGHVLMYLGSHLSAFESTAGDLKQAGRHWRQGSEHTEVDFLSSLLFLLFWSHGLVVAIEIFEFKFD